MRVFLSWSGPVSRELATLFHEWIPLVIQCAHPFISTGDIDKGKRWSDVLGKQLSKSEYGIVCVTKENYTSPWLHFEAGAISKAINKAYVSPLLFDVKPSEIGEPLSQFQVTVCTKEDIFNLIRSINSRLGNKHGLTEDVLMKVFERWWPDLKANLDKLQLKNGGRSHTSYDWLYTTKDLFIEANKRKEPTCVWWITPNPFHYVDRFKEAIRECIKRDFTFTFIFPEDRSADAKRKINQIAPDKHDRIETREIPVDEFQPEAITDYVVIDPDGHSSTEVFLALPVAPQDFWIKVVGEPAGHIAKRFRTLAKRQGEDLPSPAPVVALNPATEIARN